MSGQDIQKKTFRLLQGEIKYTGIVRSNITVFVVQAPSQTSSPEPYTADKAVIIEHLEKEKEVINDLLSRFSNNTDSVG